MIDYCFLTQNFPKCFHTFLQWHFFKNGNAIPGPGKLQFLFLHIVKSQIFVLYPFSYVWLENGSYELVFVLFEGLKTKFMPLSISLHLSLTRSLALSLYLSLSISLSLSLSLSLSYAVSLSPGHLLPPFNQPSALPTVKSQIFLRHLISYFWKKY